MFILTGDDILGKMTQNNLRERFPQSEALSLIPEAMARKYAAIPLSINGNVLQVAMTNPQDIFAIEALASQSQMRIEAELATAKEIQEAIDFNYKAYDEIEKQSAKITSGD